MKKETKKPWLNANGKPLAEGELKKLVKSWSEDEWENYLRWYESGRSESLVSPDAYDMLCEERSGPIYEKFKNNVSQAERDYCTRQLCALPKIEENVLRLYYQEGLTEFAIAHHLNRSQCGVHLIKKRAISRIKARVHESDLIALRIMRGLDSKNEAENASIWETKTLGPVRENRVYHPDARKEEFAKIAIPALRAALQALTDFQQEIIYRRYWCDQPIAKIAHDFGVGVNVIQSILEASVFKIKSQIAAELGRENQEVLPCA